MSVADFLNYLDDDCKVTVHFSFHGKYVGVSTDVIKGESTMENLQANLCNTLLNAKVDTISPTGRNFVSIHVELTD